MRQGSGWRQGFVWMLCALAAGGLRAEVAPVPQALRRWAWDQVKSWRYAKQDAIGQSLWENKAFFDLSYDEQTQQLLGRLGGGTSARRAALVVLGERPLERWAKAALGKPGDRDEVAHFLYRRGYKAPGQDPYAYLDPAGQVERPWTQGLGLHLDPGGAWRFQWISSPVLLPRMDAAGALPAALASAAQPTALVHLARLRPGLARLQELAGGGEGMVATLAEGSRAGFFVKHLEAWLKQASPALAPLADREAWVLHYGLDRRSPGPQEGTLVFLPGELPTRTRLALALLKLNPVAMGPRTRSATWTGTYGGKADVTQVRGSGGILNVGATADGTWICDREAPLRAVLFSGPAVTLGERAEWCKVALAGMRPRTEVSLWLIPRLGAGAAFERLALRRRMLGGRQDTWNNPFIAKAAPRGGTLSLALGAGPTERLIQSVFRKDQEAPIEDPGMPEIADGGENLTPEQGRAYQAALASARERRQARQALRKEVGAVTGLLDLQGAAFYWKGWVAAPPLDGKEKAAQAEFRKLQKEDPYRTSRLQGQGKAGFYGGYGEPGMSPGMALAVPVQAGKRQALEAVLKTLWSRGFKGRLESREYAKGVLLHRVRTGQAFFPCHALVGETLVLGTDDGSVASVVGGLLGQAPTLADLQGKGFGLAQIDGASAAADLEVLLLAYLRASQGGSVWWFGEPAPTDDEATAEVAATFGPFLGALKALGTRVLDLEWTPGGLEARPR